MIETNESPEDVERLLAEARKALQDFEDSVDYRRLLLRLRTASPAHPVLLARFLFGAMAVLCLLAGVVVMVITVVNNDLARTLAKFEAVIPYVPEGVPALPAVLGVLAACMVVAWAMSTGAALAIGRDAQMLPWEQKQHQKLVNEVTRLTTQKAVMERIRSTPAGARPRIATPVPVSLRSRSQGGGAASRGSHAGTGGGAAAGGFSRTPGPVPSYLESPSGASSPASRSTPGGFGRAPSYGAPSPSPATGSAPASGGLAARAARSGALRSGAASRSGASGAGGFAPVSASVAPAGYTPPPPVPSNGSSGPSFAEPEEVELQELGDEEEETVPDPDAIGGVRLGAGTPGVRLGIAKPVEEETTEDFADLIEVEPDVLDTVEDSGILAKARAGALGLRSTPYGSAGRVRPGPMGRSTRGGTPLGAPPQPGAGAVGPGKKPRLAAPLGFPGTPDAAADRKRIPADMFGTPPPIARSSTPSLEQQPLDEVMVMEEEEDAPTHAGGPLEQVSNRRIPTWGRIQDDWLRDALQKSEALVRGFPVQAYIEFSQEPNLPFTLVIARATPAMAVRAMVNFVEFLASIYTPPRARIELVNVAHLDRSFHKNVEAALEPYFGSNVEVEPNPGRVDILFTDPDPGWGAYPLLPME